MKRHGFLVVSLALLSACSGLSLGGPSVPAGKAVDELSPAPFEFGAMSIGQAKDVDHARAEGLGLVPASPLDVYLNGVLAKLLAQSPVSGVPARVYVRASGDWGASTTADANIYVSVGTLLRLDSEDEVAALLSHEAAHVILGHADADVVQEVQQRAIQLSTIALAVRDTVASRGTAGAVQTGADSARVGEQMKALAVNTALLAPAWTREQERDADLLGADLLARCGYNPQAALSLLRKQAEFETARAANPQAQLLEQQLSALGVDVVQKERERSAAMAGSGETKDQLLGVALAVGLNAAMNVGSQVLAEAKRNHPKAEERLADAELYVGREYAGAAQAPLQVEAWEAAKEEPATYDLLESYIAAMEAKDRLADGDVAAASELAEASLTEATRGHAYPQYVAAEVLTARGSAESALRSYEAALQGPEPAGAIYVEASQLYWKTGQRQRAFEVLFGGYRRLQEPPALAVPLIRTYRALGKQDDADRLAAECALRWPKMQELCAAEAKGRDVSAESTARPTTLPSS